MRVGEDNLIQFRFFEKETTSQRTVQKRTAMEQNSKIQVVANDLVRRLCKTMEELGSQEIIKMVDNYTQNLLNSGYTVEETRAIIVKGLKGYEGRKNKCKREGRSLWRTAAQSGGARQMKKPSQIGTGAERGEMTMEQIRPEVGSRGRVPRRP